MNPDEPSFVWDPAKAEANLRKHGVSFVEAAAAFGDPKRVIVRNEKHSQTEVRFFCIGETGRGICTVRFTMRNGKIRIIGAGYWREGKAIYEKQ